MKKLFGTDGIRGIVNEVITPKLSGKTWKCFRKIL